MRRFLSVKDRRTTLFEIPHDTRLWPLDSSSARSWRVVRLRPSPDVTACGVSPCGIHLWNLRGVRDARLFRLGSTPTPPKTEESDRCPPNKRKEEQVRPLQSQGRGPTADLVVAGLSFAWQSPLFLTAAHSTAGKEARFHDIRSSVLGEKCLVRQASCVCSRSLMVVGWMGGYVSACSVIEEIKTGEKSVAGWVEPARHLADAYSVRR